MLGFAAITLVLLWFFGLISSNTLGGGIHILLIVAVVLIVARMVQGRRR